MSNVRAQVCHLIILKAKLLCKSSTSAVMSEHNRCKYTKREINVRMTYPFVLIYVSCICFKNLFPAVSQTCRSRIFPSFTLSPTRCQQNTVFISSAFFGGRGMQTCYGLFFYCNEGFILHKVTVDTPQLAVCLSRTANIM